MFLITLFFQNIRVPTDEPNLLVVDRDERVYFNDEMIYTQFSIFTDKQY